MKKILKGAVSILLMAALSIPMFSMAAMGAETTEVPVVQVPVTLELTGYKPFTPEELNVVLTAEDKRNPMPEGRTDGVYNLKVAAAGQYTLGPIAFPNLGIYQYTIRQTAGTNAKGQYDSNLYRMIIYVTNAQTGGRETTVVVYKNQDTAKSENIVFTNNYTGGSGSSGGGGGGGGSRSGGGSTSTVVTQIIDEAPPLSPMDTLTGIMEGEIPLAALPKTGTLWWLVPLLALGGIGMFGAGVYKSRRNRHEEE